MVFVQEHAASDQQAKGMVKAARAAKSRLILGPACTHSGRPTAGVGALARAGPSLSPSATSCFKLRENEGWAG
eukprot:14901160-Alexandrium_andersonii.AAC.1